MHFVCFVSVLLTVNIISVTASELLFTHDDIRTVLETENNVVGPIQVTEPDTEDKELFPNVNITELNKLYKLQEINSSASDNTKIEVKTETDLGNPSVVDKPEKENADLFPNVDISDLEKVNVKSNQEEKIETDKEANSVHDDNNMKKNNWRQNIIQRLQKYIKRIGRKLEKEPDSVQGKKIDEENEVPSEERLTKYGKARKQMKIIMKKYMLKGGSKYSPEDVKALGKAEEGLTDSIRQRMTRSRIDAAIKNVNRTINFARRSEESHRKQLNFMISSFQNKTSAEVEKMRDDFYKMVDSAKGDKPTLSDKLQECIQGDLDVVKILIEESIVNIDKCINGTTNDILNLINILASKISDLENALAGIIKRLESCTVIRGEMNGECLEHILAELSINSPIFNTVTEVTSTVIRQGLLITIFGNTLNGCASPILSTINSVITTSVANLLDCIAIDKKPW